MRVLRNLLFVLVTAGVAAGCYLPNEFTADLRITPAGDYNFQYQGELVYLPLLEKLSDGPLTPDELRRQVEAIDQDLARDRGFQEISYVDRATFRVRYKRIGNIAREKSFTFVRQNARLLSIERYPDGRVRIVGDKPNTELVEKLEDIGYVMRGRFRVQTEAQVSHHNAGSVQNGAAAVYVWPVEGVKQASPQLEFVLRGP
jgi:hypothetical protein